MGGLSGAPSLLRAARRAGVAVSPHIFGHVHAQAMAGLGEDVPIEWGGPAVDAWAAPLAAPVVRDGRMEPLAEQPGFGELVPEDWLTRQGVAV